MPDDRNSQPDEVERILRELGVVLHRQVGSLPYQRAARIGGVHFACVPRFPNMPSMRLDLNPAGISDDDGRLSSLLLAGFGDAPSVTRLDSAVDYDGLRARDVSVHLPRAQVHTKFDNQNGGKGLRVGSPHSRRHLVVYDWGTRHAEGDLVRCRMEMRSRRCRSGGGAALLLRQLAELPNPFTGIDVSAPRLDAHPELVMAKHHAVAAEGVLRRLALPFEPMTAPDRLWPPLSGTEGMP